MSFDSGQFEFGERTNHPTYDARLAIGPCLDFYGETEYPERRFATRSGTSFRLRLWVGDAELSELITLLQIELTKRIIRANIKAAVSADPAAYMVDDVADAAKVSESVADDRIRDFLGGLAPET